MVSSIDNINAQIEQIEDAHKTNPDNLYYLSALVGLYFNRNQGEDVIKAINASKEVLASTCESTLTKRAKALVFSRRGQYYRIQQLYDLALSDLTNAKVDTLYDALSESERKRIEKELSLVREKLYPEEAKTEEGGISWGACNGDAGRRMSSLASNQYGGYVEANQNPVVDSFYQMLEFLDGELDSPSASNGLKNEKYWGGFAYCRKGMELLVTNGDKQKAEKYIEKAAKSFRSLKSSSSFVPSVIHFYLAMIYFIQNKFSEALAEIQVAIEKNPDAVAYLKARVLIYEARAKEESANYTYTEEIALDEKKIAELAPYSSVYNKVLHEYNQVNHMIEFYDQVKTDKTTYAEVLKELIALKKITLKSSRIKALTASEIVDFFAGQGIRLKEDPAPYDPIPFSLYNELSNKCDLDMIPKRGETLDPLHVLHLKAGGTCSILCLENPERFQEEAFMHFTWVIENEPPLSVFDSPWAKAHFMKASLHHKLSQFEEELKHLNILNERIPGNQTILSCIDNVLKRN